MDNNVAQLLDFLKDLAPIWVPVGAAVWTINRSFKSQIETSGEKLQKNLDNISTEFREFRTQMKADMNSWIDRVDAAMRESRQQREEDKREYQLERRADLERSDRKHEEANAKHDAEWKEANEKHEKEWKDLLGKFHLVDKTVALMEKNKD